MMPTNIFQILTKINPQLKNMQNTQNINTPDDAAQFFLNHGIVKQDQVNWAKQAWGQRGDIRQKINSKFGL